VDLQPAQRSEQQACSVPAGGSSSSSSSSGSSSTPRRRPAAFAAALAACSTWQQLHELTQQHRQLNGVEVSLVVAAAGDLLAPLLQLQGSDARNISRLVLQQLQHRQQLLPRRLPPLQPAEVAQLQQLCLLLLSLLNDSWLRAQDQLPAAHLNQVCTALLVLHAVSQQLLRGALDGYVAGLLRRALPPQQLTTAIHSCARPWRLAALCACLGVQFNELHAAAAIVQLARMQQGQQARAGGGGAASSPLPQLLAQQLLSGLVQRQQQRQQQHQQQAKAACAAQALWALGRLGGGARQRQWQQHSAEQLRQLQQVCLQQLKALDGGEVAMLVQGSRQLQLPWEPQQEQLLLQHLQHLLQTRGAACAADVAFAAAQLDSRPPAAWMEGLAAALPAPGAAGGSDGGSVPDRQLARCLRALQLLGAQPPAAWAEAAQQQLLVRARSCGVRDLGISMLAAGKLGLGWRAAEMQVLVDAAAGQLQGAGEPRAAADTVRVLQAASLYVQQQSCDGQLELQHLFAATQPWLASAAAGDLTLLLRAAAGLVKHAGQQPPDAWLATVLSAAAQRLPTCSPPALAGAVWALGLLAKHGAVRDCGSDSGNGSAARDGLASSSAAAAFAAALEPHVLQAAPQMAPRHVALLLCGIGWLHQACPGWQLPSSYVVERSAAQLEAAVAMLPADEVAAAMHGLRLLGEQGSSAGPLLLRSLLAGDMWQLQEAGAQECVVLLRAAADWKLALDQQQLRALLGRMHALLPSCSVHELVSSVVSLQRLPPAESAAAGPSSPWPASGAAASAAAPAAARALPPSVVVQRYLQAAVARATELLPAFASSDCARLLSALRCMAWHPGGLFLAQLYQQPLLTQPLPAAGGAARAAERVSVLFCLASLREVPPPAWTDSMLQSISSHVAVLGAQSLAELAWSIGQLEVSPAPVWVGRLPQLAAAQQPLSSWQAARLEAGLTDIHPRLLDAWRGLQHRQQQQQQAAAQQQRQQQMHRHRLRQSQQQSTCNSTHA
jgi:hypothetical protein